MSVEQDRQIARAEMAAEVQIWMSEAFASVDFNRPPEIVLRSLTLAWSEVLHKLELVALEPA